MSDIYDLRKFQIKNKEAALEFLELIEARIPQIITVLKKQSLREASLMNRINSARPVVEPVSDGGDKNVSVIKQLTQPDQTPSAADSRIQQMRDAQTQLPQEKKDQIAQSAKQIRETGRISQLKPEAPGEIGTLHIEETPVVTDAPKEEIKEEVTEPPVNPAIANTKPTKADVETVGSKVAKAQAKEKTEEAKK